jgi:hypothetical protein
MTKPLTKEELIRSAWITALRMQGHRQCHGKFRDGDLVCALQILREVVGPVNERLTVLAGISLEQFGDVVLMNDGVGVHKHTFAEIADVVEGWFRKS